MLSENAARKAAIACEFEDRVVGIIEARDGTIMDVVRKVKTFD